MLVAALSRIVGRTGPKASDRAAREMRLYKLLKSIAASSVGARRCTSTYSAVTP
jgi:hypothetical protein